MTDMAIDSRVYAANYRSEPDFGNNILGSLNQCDPVKVVGEQQGDRWMPCEVHGVSKIVFISKNVLRDQVSATKERLMRECVKQWLRFDKETGKEHITPYFKHVGEYWQSIGLNLDGKDRDVPWSAAFISFCVREAGGYNGFKFAAAHSRYVHQAIRRKLDGNNGPFWGFKNNEHKVQLGDMVCRSRTSPAVDYAYAANHDSFQSHCDIVISIREDHVSTLGGNVSHTVKRTNYPINSSGFLTGDNRSYAVMRNNR